MENVTKGWNVDSRTSGVVPVQALSSPSPQLTWKPFSNLMKNSISYIKTLGLAIRKTISHIRIILLSSICLMSIPSIFSRPKPTSIHTPNNKQNKKINKIRNKSKYITKNKNFNISKNNMNSIIYNLL